MKRRMLFNDDGIFLRHSSRLIKIMALSLCLSLSAGGLCGCAQDDPTAKEDSSDTAPDSEQDYTDYIHDALEAVNKDAKVDVGDVPPVPSASTPDSGKVIYVEKEDSESVPESVFVSSSEAEDSFVDPADETKGQKDADSEPAEKQPTPDDFEVGTGLVYIDGKYDTAYASNLAAEINAARTGLNYDPFTQNTSLGTCANLRAKEITCFLSHYRPDGSTFFSLAPDYYKAELIAIDAATPKETLDAWMSDPISRGILMSKDYTTFGVSNYVCNTLNCIVVSLGY